MVSAISFTSNVQNQSLIQPKKVEEFVTHYEYTYEKPATSGRKWGVGIASGFIPGLGQAINGDWLKAGLFCAGNIALNIFAKSLTSTSKVIATVASLALNVGAVYDAVKCAKSKVVQVVSKSDTNFNAQV
ncbi:hypothetical protein IKB17_05495 [bacterium]|nr:hypothetical protein [bacterium]